MIRSQKVLEIFEQCIRSSDQKIIESKLQPLYTPQLLQMLHHSRWLHDSSHPFVVVLKQLLATREHVPTKLDKKRIRQMKAKSRK